MAISGFKKSKKRKKRVKFGGKSALSAEQINLRLNFLKLFLIWISNFFGKFWPPVNFWPKMTFQNDKTAF